MRHRRIHSFVSGNVADLIHACPLNTEMKFKMKPHQKFEKVFADFEVRFPQLEPEAEGH